MRFTAGVANKVMMASSWTESSPRKGNFRVFPADVLQYNAKKVSLRWHTRLESFHVLSCSL